MKNLIWNIRLNWARFKVLVECIYNELHDVPDILED